MQQRRRLPAQLADHPVDGGRPVRQSDIGQHRSRSQRRAEASVDGRHSDGVDRQPLRCCSLPLAGAQLHRRPQPYFVGCVRCAPLFAIRTASSLGRRDVIWGVWVSACQHVIGLCSVVCFFCPGSDHCQMISEAICLHGLEHSCCCCLGPRVGSRGYVFWLLWP